MGEHVSQVDPVDTIGESIHVLHVDDEPDFADMAATFLEREDDRFVVESATSASEGLERLAADDFDCVISDYDMPGQTGIEFLEAVREEYPDLPFILYTGKGSEEVASDAISAGVTDYLQKETGTSQYAVLANRIRNAIEQYQTRTELADREQRLNLFFEQSPLGVIEWDENFDVVRVNAAAEEILGYTEDELTGRSWEVIVPESDRTPVDEVVSDLLEDEGGYHSINENVRKDGERIVCEWHNRVVTDNTGDVVAIFSQFQDITERKTRERELEETNALLSTLFETLPAGVLAEDASRNVLAVNERLFELFEMAGTPGEVIGTDCEHMAERVSDMFVDGDRFVERINELVANREPTDNEELSLHDGRTFERSYRPIELPDGGGHLWLYQEITDRKEREQQLEEERAFSGVALDSVVDFYWILDLEGYVIDWSDEDGAVTGYPAEEAIGMHATDLFPEYEQNYIAEMIEELRETGTVTARADFETKDGDLVPYRFDGTTLTDSEGRVDRMGGFGQDVSEHVEREQQLREEQEFTEQVINTLPDILYVVATDGTLKRWNQRLWEVTGYPEEEIADMQAIEFFVEEDQPRVAEAIDDVLTTGQAIVEADIRTATGERTPIELTGARLHDTEGEIIGLVGIGRDITERKEYEEKLERVRQRMQFALRATDAIVWDWNVDEDNATFYPSEGGLYGTTVESWDEFIELVHPDDRSTIRESFEQSLDTGGLKHEEIRIVHDGEVRWIEAPGQPMQDDDGTTHLVGVASDVTEQKQREQELQRKNERLEEFAGIVSHDLRNPLSVAEGNLELAREECESERLDAVAKAHDRMELLIDDLLALAREGEEVVDAGPVDLPDFTENCWRNVDTSEATLVADTDRTVRADRSRLAQLLENLFRNAVEHGGEEVTITVGDLEDGFYVADDGPGIPADERERIFESGYTTSDEGTGFGLAIVQEIVEAHDWNIEVTDSGTGGARFEITGVESA